MSRSSRGQIQAPHRSGFAVQRNGWHLRQIDWLIGLREKLLNGLSGVKPGDVLNAAPAGFPPENGTDPASDLKRALDRIRYAAMDESGAQMEYASLRASAVYQEFRAKNSSPL